MENVEENEENKKGKEENEENQGKNEILEENQKCKRKKDCIKLMTFYFLPFVFSFSFFFRLSLLGNH